MSSTGTWNAHRRRSLLPMTSSRPPDTSTPALASDVAQLEPRIAVVGEMISLANPWPTSQPSMSTAATSRPGR